MVLTGCAITNITDIVAGIEDATTAKTTPRLLVAQTNGQES